jgi:hypothetical protein
MLESLMKRGCAVLCTVFWSVVVILRATEALLGASPQAQNPQTLIGEVIVKFAAGSEAHQVIAGAMRGDLQSDARLVRLANSLSDQLNVPLKSSQVTSGQELVLSIDADAIASKVAEQFSHHSDVGNAKMVESGDMKAPAQRNRQVIIEFVPASETGEELSKVSPENIGRSPTVQRLITDIEQNLGVKLTVLSAQRNEIVLVIHIDSLTADLVERLRKRPDVEYAQPSFLLRPL